MTLIWYFYGLQGLLKIYGLKGKALFLLVFSVADKVIVHIEDCWSICDYDFFGFQWGLYSGYSPYFILSAILNVNCCIQHLVLWIFYLEFFRKVFLFFYLANQNTDSPEKSHLFCQAECFKGPFKSVVNFFGASGAKSTAEKRGMVLYFFLHEIQLIFKLGGLGTVRGMNSLGFGK